MAERKRPTLRVLLVAAPLTLISVAARVLILPTLAATMSGAPQWGEAAVGSFALLHSQLVLPMPAGAGAVDVGLLAGAHGAAHAGALLLHWRLYTSGLGLVLGLLAVPWSFGRARCANLRAGRWRGLVRLPAAS